MSDIASIEFYRDRRGRSDAEDFVNGLDAKKRAKIENKFEMLQAHGWNDSIASGILANFGEKIYEIRVPKRTRLLAFRALTDAGQSIVVVLAFKKAAWKKNQKKKLVELAQRRRDDWLARRSN